MHAGKSIVNGLGSFVGVSQGQSFVMPNVTTDPLVSPSKLQRVNSSDKLTVQSESKPSNQNTSPENADDFADQLQGIDNGKKNSDFITMTQVAVKEGNESLPGSMVEASGEPAYENDCPVVVCADDEYKSQKSDDFADVKVEPCEEQGKVVDEKNDNKKNINLRRDPEEEFFMLAILAHKMQHIENQETEFIYQVDSAKLFEQVKEIKLPFHKWYAWLDTKFQMMRVAFE
jgi:hypothetical protein